MIHRSNQINQLNFRKQNRAKLQASVLKRHNRMKLSHTPNPCQPKNAPPHQTPPSSYGGNVSETMTIIAPNANRVRRFMAAFRSNPIIRIVCAAGGGPVNSRAKSEFARANYANMPSLQAAVLPVFVVVV